MAHRSPRRNPVPGLTLPAPGLTRGDLPVHPRRPVAQEAPDQVRGGVSRTKGHAE
jgi:hypothetical protein